MRGNEALNYQSRFQLEPIDSGRRTFTGAALAALVATASPLVANAEDSEAPNNPFILLLNGIYRPVPAGGGPESNLGLTAVNLSDGSYSKTRIYPVFGIDGVN